MIQKLLFLQKKLSYAVTTFLMDAQKKEKLLKNNDCYYFLASNKKVVTA